ncbi:MAG: DUF3179 domain-containing protein [Acidobacteria bacterium]|nr:DUF3179 domain-containing protein [Acidobacteriota bacterium]
MKRVSGIVVTLTLAGPLASGRAQAPVPIARFVDAASEDRRTSEPALQTIQAEWRNGYAGLLIELARFMRAPRQARPVDIAASASAADAGGAGRAGEPISPLGDPGSPARRRLLQFLEQRTGQKFGDDLDRWRAWLWRSPYEPHPDFAALKRVVYSQLDPRLGAFFPDGVRALIRLDEIDWGGVRVNGIPPLRQPRYVAANHASFMKDSNVVFGLFVNGEARAYPRRILAWHELALDRLGGVDLAIVYCTLCGTVMPYESTAGGRSFHFGTSGLLYQSNKLMFDEETNSLWSTFEGKPVVGALAGTSLSLRTRPVVTTTWKAWKTAHPETTVLSLDTGYNRDYSEGAAYRDYFASDQLMFQVSRTDRRLALKDEVLVMRLPGGSGGTLPVAIDVRLLKKHAVYAFSSGERHYVVVSDQSGANRVFAVADAWPKQANAARIVDARGRRWRLTEDALVPEGTTAGEFAPRVSAQRAFWFGWFAQFPDTLLLE